MKYLKHFLIAVCMVFVLVGTSWATMIDVGFTRIEPSNASVDVADQLSLTIMDYTDANSTYSTLSLNTSQVLFTFMNDVDGEGNTYCSISETYIDDGTIVGLSSVVNSLGGSTSFVGGSASPGNLPGGNNLNPPFVATSSYSADAQGNPDLGVDASIDILGIIYDLHTNLTINDVQLALNSGDLRIGLHVRSIGNDSDAFVNDPGNPVPEPATIFLFGAGLLGLAAVQRKRLNKKNNK